MKYLKYILLLSVFIICSCDSNAFIGKIQIDPEVNSVAGDITVTYRIGDLLILDTWDDCCDLETAEKLHLINGDAETFMLTVTAGDCNGVSFEYEVDGTIQVKTKPVNWKTIVKAADNFDTITWTAKDGKIINESNQVPIVNNEPTDTNPRLEEGSKL